MEAVLERMSVIDQGPVSQPGAPDWFNASREPGWKRFQELSKKKGGGEEEK